MKKSHANRPIETALIIKPNCLKVDKAIIFLKSYSKLAPKPAINIVKPETTRRKIHNRSLKVGLNRINK
jgi:hypothetical protein